MVSVQDIKDYLLIKNDEQDNFIEKNIERTSSFIKEYCNNDFSEGFPLAIEDIIIQLVCLKVDTQTRLRAGKSSEGQGAVNVSYANDIPEEMKRVLNQYRRIKFLTR